MKKGDLALSTSAIVALTVAIVVLGLIVVFVTRGFGSASDLVDKEAANVPEPATPTASQPVTLSLLPTATIGDQLRGKVGVYNPCGEPITISHSVDCKDPLGVIAPITDEGGIQHELATGQRTSVAFLGSIDSGTGAGRSLCTVTVDVWSESGVECSALNGLTATTAIEFVE